LEIYYTCQFIISFTNSYLRQPIVTTLATGIEAGTFGVSESSHTMRINSIQNTGTGCVKDNTGVGAQQKHRENIRLQQKLSTETQI